MINWKLFFDIINPDNTMTFNRLFAHSIGMTETVIYFSLISKCKYWESRNQLIDGEWFYSTTFDLQESTTFSKYQQKKAVDNLVKIGLIKCEMKGIPAKRCFAINEDPELLCSIIENGKEVSKKLQIQSSEKNNVNNSFTQMSENSEKYSSQETLLQGDKRKIGSAINNFDYVYKKYTSIPENTEKSSSQETLLQGVKKFHCKELRNFTARSKENDTPINNLNKNKLNKINLSNQSISKAADVIDEDMIKATKELILSNIEYDELIERSESDKSRIDEIVDNMLEMSCTNAKTMRIGGSDVPAELIKGRIMKIDSGHMEYILLCLKRNTTKVRNIKAYLRTVIYNAPSTMDNFYGSEVNNALYGNI